MRAQRAVRDLAWCAAAIGLLARPAAAQPAGAVERFAPAVPGDAMFGVPSPAVGGHLVPRAAAVFDFAHKPLSIQDGEQRSAIVSRQAVLHLVASLALWDRLLVSGDMPIVLLQAGDSPTIAGATITSPSRAQAGDLRLGARARIWGDFWAPFQIGVGAYLFVPTGPRGSFAGDGAVRGEPQILLGGRAPHLVWSAALGATVRGSAHPHTFTLGVGAALVIGEELLQIGPELTLAAPFTKDLSLSTSTATVTTAGAASAELLLGAKVRPIRPLVIGLGAGPGLSHGWGTPVFFAVGSVAYEPLPPKLRDRDEDGIADEDDACPDARGVKSEDRRKNGCPADRDGDGIPDVVDACPEVKGVNSEDPKKNGCPPDGDEDGIADAEDACPDIRGVKSEDPKKNGCPPDRDGDGIPDAADACPDVKGIIQDDPKKHGCPPDRDDDGVPDAVDACPDVKGAPDPNPKVNGCPLVTVTQTEIVISRQVLFLFGKAGIAETVDPVSDALLEEVRSAIVKHPEIELVEVQGHADPVGTDAFNQKLSEARATAVRRWLTTRGIPGKKLTIKGYGARVPIASNDTDEGRQENRRVQFVIKRKAKDKPEPRR